jgi:hypothetical protein
MYSISGLSLYLTNCLLGTFQESDNSGTSSRFAVALSNVQQGVSQFKTIARRFGRHQHTSVLPPDKNTASAASEESDFPTKSVAEPSANGPTLSEQPSVAYGDGYQQVIYFSTFPTFVSVMKFFNCYYYQQLA